MHDVTGRPLDGSAPCRPRRGHGQRLVSHRELLHVPRRPPGTALEQDALDLLARARAFPRAQRCLPADRAEHAAQLIGHHAPLTATNKVRPKLHEHASVRQRAAMQRSGTVAADRSSQGRRAEQLARGLRPVYPAQQSFAPPAVPSPATAGYWSARVPSPAATDRNRCKSASGGACWPVRVTVSRCAWLTPEFLVTKELQRSLDRVTSTTLQESAGCSHAPASLRVCVDVVWLLTEPTTAPRTASPSHAQGPCRDPGRAPVRRRMAPVGATQARPAARPAARLHPRHNMPAP